MDDWKLRVMLTTLRTGSFGKAALELNCSQPAVTQIINSMENELGCKLFLRSHSGVQLTPEGAALLPLIVEADACHRRLADQAKAISRGDMMPVRIAAFSSLSHAWLPNAIKEFQQRNPSVSFEIRISTNEITTWLQQGEVDIALADAQRCEGFQWQPLMDDPYLAVMHRSLAPEGVTAIHQEDLGRYPFIMTPLERHNISLSHRPMRCLTVNSDDNSTLFEMVAQGLGVTAAPKLTLYNLPPEVRVLELQPPVKRVLGMAMTKSPSKQVKAFADFLLKRVEQFT